MSLGIRLNLWEKVGKVEFADKIDVFFRGTEDFGTKNGKSKALISENWYVWQIGDNKTLKVGKLTGEYRNAEIGLVVNPHEIVERIRTGKYVYFYPGYE